VLECVYPAYNTPHTLRPVTSLVQYASRAVFVGTQSLGRIAPAEHLRREAVQGYPWLAGVWTHVRESRQQ
jgi:hypothetical protein